MNKLRLSYSLLNAWKRKDFDRIGDLYLHTEKTPTEAQRRGLDFDKMVEEYATQHGTLPPELGSIELDSPTPKVRGVIPYDEKVDISYEMDILCTNYIVEIKCSEGYDSADFSTTLQIPMYFLVCHLSNIVVDHAWVYRYDPLHNTYDRTKIYNSDRKIKEAMIAIDTEAPEIYQFLSNQGLL